MVFKNMKGSIVWEGDLDKRPSDLEIKDKDLPTNTPTLEHRIHRDQVYKFFVPDRKAGYHLGKYGNAFDYIDDDMTLKGLYFISRSSKSKDIFLLLIDFALNLKKIDDIDKNI